jgi:AcrR family transcriptional regulator
MARPSPAILSREAIIDVAWHMIDSEGTSALSMRRLAGKLGVSGPSLYHHFVSKDEILDGIVIRIYEQIRLTQKAPDWEGILTEYATQLRAVLNAHPHVVEFVALRPVTSPVSMAVYERTLNELADCGWSPGLAREAALAIENFVFGSALMANAPIELEPEQRLQFPKLAATSEGPSDNPPDDAFELGFTALVAGLRMLVIDGRDGANDVGGHTASTAIDSGDGRHPDQAQARRASSARSTSTSPRIATS